MYVRTTYIVTDDTIIARCFRTPSDGAKIEDSAGRNNFKYVCIPTVICTYVGLGRSRIRPTYRRIPGENLPASKSTTVFPDSGHLT